MSRDPDLEYCTTQHGAMGHTRRPGASRTLCGQRVWVHAHHLSRMVPRTHCRKCGTMEGRAVLVKSLCRPTRKAHL